MLVWVVCRDRRVFRRGLQIIFDVLGNDSITLKALRFAFEVLGSPLLLLGLRV